MKKMKFIGKTLTFHKKFRNTLQLCMKNVDVFSAHSIINTHRPHWTNSKFDAGMRRDLAAGKHSARRRPIVEKGSPPNGDEDDATRTNASAGLNATNR